jgi:(2Fe-2S) ferredoxin
MTKKKHIFVCVQNRPVGHPRSSCQAKGSPLIYQAFVQEFTRLAIWDEFRLSSTGCLGPCAHGASVVVYPDGVLYGHVTAEDVPIIVQDHLLADRPVQRLAVEAW